jgi:AbrB family looped-hinge helix DNA binding protein
MKIQIDSEGRINIPQVLKDNLRLLPGDSFRIEQTDEGILLIPVHAKKNHSDSVIVLNREAKEKPKYFTVK